MIDDDDALGDYDLSAWDVPPPASTLADDVVSRMREGAGAVALDTTVTRAIKRGTRRWIVGAAIAAGAAGAVALALWGFTRTPANGGGALAVKQPTHVELGESSSVDLEASTELVWHREAHRLTAALPRGETMWKVDAEDTLVIDAGAAVASVEATGASLRVEVKMNLSDARVIGASALTSAAVAIITVVVYEGHVRVTSGGQTVNVQPGGTVEVRPPGPPTPPIPDEPDKAPIVAGTPDRNAIDAAALNAGIAQLQALAESCRSSGFAGAFDLTVGVEPNGTVTVPKSEVVRSGTDVPTVIACARDKIVAEKLPETQHGGMFTLTVEGVPPCDAAQLLSDGDLSVGKGDHARALVLFEQALACKPSGNLVVRAYVAACNSRNDAVARKYYAQIDPSKQGSYSQICIRNGIQLDTAATVATAPVAVAPSVLEAQRISGDRNISPDDSTKRQIERDGKTRVVGSFKLCTSTDGNVTSVAKLKSTGYSAYDSKIERGLRTWRYKPYLVAGTPTPVCTAVTFIYSQAPGAAARDPSGSPPCDVDALVAAGGQEVGKGNHARALISFEQAMACKPTGQTIARAYVAACNSRNEAVAKRYFRMLDAAKQGAYSQICIRNGVMVGP